MWGRKAHAIPSSHRASSAAAGESVARRVNPQAASLRVCIACCDSLLLLLSLSLDREIRRDYQRRMSFLLPATHTHCDSRSAGAIISTAWMPTAASEAAAAAAQDPSPGCKAIKSSKDRGTCVCLSSCLHEGETRVASLLWERTFLSLSLFF